MPIGLSPIEPTIGYGGVVGTTIGYCHTMGRQSHRVADSHNYYCGSNNTAQTYQASAISTSETPSSAAITVKEGVSHVDYMD